VRAIAIETSTLLILLALILLLSVRRRPHQLSGGGRTGGFKLRVRRGYKMNSALVSMDDAVSPSFRIQMIEVVA
jgi:hypothetical protein